VREAEILGAGKEDAALETLLLEKALQEKRLGAGLVAEADHRARRISAAIRAGRNPEGPRQHVETVLKFPPLFPKVADHVAASYFENRRPGRRQGKRLAAEGKGEEDFVEERHDLPFSDHRGKRISVGDGLAEAGQVRRHAEILLGAAQGEAEAGDHFVEDEHAPLPERQLPQLFEEAVAGCDDARGFQDDRGHAARVLPEDPLSGSDVVVGEGDGKGAAALRHASVSRRRPDVPVLPSMVAAAGDHFPAREGTGGADRSGGCIGAVLAETDHLRARDDLGQHLRHLHLQRVGKGEGDAVRHLPGDRLRHGGIAVAEDDGSECKWVVDIFVSVDVPDAAALCAGEEHGRDPVDELGRTLAHRLRAGGDDPPGARQKRHGRDEASRARRRRLFAGQGGVEPFIADSTRIDPREFGFTVQQGEDFREAEAVSVASQAFIDGAHELQVRRLVDGPAQVARREVGCVFHARDPEALGVANVARHVFAVRRKMRLFPCLFEGGKGEGLDIEAVRIGVAQSVRHVVDVSVKHAPDDLVQNGRVDQRTVGGDPHDDIGVKRGRGAIEAIQDILFAAAEDVDATGAAERLDGIIGRPVRRGDDDLLYGLSLPYALDNVLQHGPVQNRLQDFVRQAARTHPGLDDGDNPRFPAQGFSPLHVQRPSMRTNALDFAERFAAKAISKTRAASSTSRQVRTRLAREARKWRISSIYMRLTSQVRGVRNVRQQPSSAANQRTVPAVKSQAIVPSSPTSLQRRL